MSARRIMQTDVMTLQASESLSKAVEVTTASRIRHLPILDGDRLVGMVSDRDIKRACPSALIEGSEDEFGRVLKQTQVHRIMRRAPVTAGPDAPLAELVRLMLDNRIGAVPIVEGQRLVGIVTESDVLRAFLTLLDTLH